jgi:ferredoxin
MKVKADFDLCESNAVCVGIAPDVFEVDDDDYLQILTEDVTDENRARIEQAVASCPKAALSIVES